MDDVKINSPHQVREFIALLLCSEFAQDQWSQRYLQNLEPVCNTTLVEDILHKKSQDVLHLVQDFKFQNVDSSQIQFKVAWDRPLSQVNCIALIVKILSIAEELIGFWRKLFWKNNRNETEFHFDIIKTALYRDDIRGISRKLKTYFHQLNTK